MVVIELGKVEEGLRDLDRALRLDPESARALAWRGEAGLRLGRIDEALLDLDRSVRLDPRYSRRVNTRQYVDEFSGGTAATFGQRYVFAATDRSTLSMQFRLNYAITPDFSLEGYAEQFESGDLTYDEILDRITGTPSED